VRDPYERSAAYKVPRRSAELVRRYAKGERYFEGADLAVSSELAGADLRAADLRRAHFHHANLRGADLRAVDFTEADLSGADMEGADLSAAILFGANLSFANLRNAVFDEAVLLDADLSFADLTGARLSSANLVGADLEGSTLRGARLDGCRLEFVRLNGADLRGADLSRAKLLGADLRNRVVKTASVEPVDVGRIQTDLEGTCFDEADLMGVDLRGVWLQKANLDAARLDSSQIEVIEQTQRRGYPELSYDTIDLQRTEPERVPVQIGTAAPRVAAPGSEFTVRFAAYADKHRSAASKMLAQLSPASAIVLDVCHCQWRVGADVTVTLQAKDLHVEEPTQSFRWNGSIEIRHFAVSVPADLPERTIVLKLDTFVGELSVAKILLDLEIRNGVRSVHYDVRETSAKRTAFASYSARDRRRVLDKVGAARISAGMEVFLDCLFLQPGEEFKPRIEEEISAREFFLLFWSTHAKESKWVEWEWRTALAVKGEEAFQIHPLESPEAAPPPYELAHFHFADTLVLLRAGTRNEEARQDVIAAKRGVLDAQVRPDGWITCPYCGRKFTTHSEASWDGEKHRQCRTRLNLVPTKPHDFKPHDFVDGICKKCGRSRVASEAFGWACD
jgi:uncharacterized protein YjbI with pentapeptide repeats